jgi:hypothetical protein
MLAGSLEMMIKMRMIVVVVVVAEEIALIVIFDHGLLSLVKVLVAEGMHCLIAKMIKEKKKEMLIERFLIYIYAKSL